MSAEPCEGCGQHPAYCACGKDRAVMDEPQVENLTKCLRQHSRNFEGVVLVDRGDLRWLLADWRRLKDVCESRDGTIERLVEDKEALRLDAARWREARSRGWVLVSESCVDAAIAKEQADGKA